VYGGQERLARRQSQLLTGHSMGRACRPFVSYARLVKHTGVRGPQLSELVHHCVVPVSFAVRSIVQPPLTIASSPYDIPPREMSTVSGGLG